MKCFNTRPVTLGMKILMRPADLYTLTVFEWTKKEVIQVMRLQHRRTYAIWRMCTNTILYGMVKSIQKRQETHVTYNVDNRTIECTCKIFEFKGILCCHALKTLNQEKIQEIPESYIMRRWMKTSKD